MTSIQPRAFSYDTLDLDTRAFVQQRTRDIQSRMQRTAADIIAIGQNLLEVKARLKHGEFMAWIATEFSMTYRTARNFMNAAQRFAGKSETVSHLPLGVLYAISGGKVSDELAQQVIDGEISASSVRTARQKQNESEEKDVTDYFWDGLDMLVNAWGTTDDNKELRREAIQTVVDYLSFIDEDVPDVDAREALTIAAQAILEGVKRSR